MKIIHLIQKPQLRGAEIAALRSAVHLQENGCEVLVVCLFRGDDKLDFPVSVVQLDENFRNRFWSIKAWWKLNRLVRSMNADVVQANAGFTLKFAVFSKVLFGWKTPLVFRNASTISKYIKTPLSRWFNGIFFNYVSLFLSVSRVSANDLSAIYPKHTSKIHVLPVGIDAMPPKPGRVNVGIPTILHVGGFTFEKNHAGLLRIFRRVLEEVPAATLILAGNGPLRPTIEKQVVELGIQENVQFLGARSDLPFVFSLADVFVLPSIIEGMPSVILESFYFEVPVVANNVGGVSEILQDNVTGALVAENDESAFAKRVVKILNNPGESLRTVANARQLVVSNYMNHQLVHETIKLYRKIVSPTKPARVVKKISQYENA